MNDFVKTIMGTFGLGVGLFFTKSTIDSAYSAGKSAGKLEGYNEGYKNGRNIGYFEGVLDENGKWLKIMTKKKTE